MVYRFYMSEIQYFKTHQKLRMQTGDDLIAVSKSLSSHTESVV